MALQGSRNHVDLGFVQVRGNLHKDGDAAILCGGQFLALGGDGPQQTVQRFVTLQGAQVFGVGGTDVDRDVICMRVHAFQADQIVVGGFFDGRGSVLANVQAQQHGLALRAHGGFSDVGNKGVQAVVVKTQTVDQTLGLRDTEHARLGITGLTLGCDGAHFHKTKAHGGQRIDTAGVLVQACGHAHTVGELQPRQGDGVVHHGCRPRQLQRRALAFGQRVHGEVVGRFGLHTK